MVMVGIYKITSVSGAIYIGQSWNIEKRQNHYKTLDCKGQPKLYNSLVKYGWQQHIFDIVYSLPNDITQNILDNYESVFIDFYKSLNFRMLNLKEGGKGGKHSQETKDKIRISSTGRKMSPEAIRKAAESHIGKKRSEESRKRMSEAAKIKIFTKEHRENIGKGAIGRKKSLEEKIKVAIRFSKSIKCIETGQVFSSLKEAGNILNIPPNSISDNLRKTTKKVRKAFTFCYN